MSETTKLTLHTKNEQQTIRLGELIGKSVEPGTIIALKGELGAGKTVFAKGIAKGLEVVEEPNSPTFVIMNSYMGRKPLFHFDLYRISSPDELFDIGYEECFYGNGVSVVEWADRLPEVIPENSIWVEFRVPKNIDDENKTIREIIIEGKQKWLSSFKNTAEQALRT